MIYLDIETVSAFPDFVSADERTQKLFYQKMRHEPSLVAATALNYNNVLWDLYKEKAGLFAEFNQVVCVTFGVVKDEVIRLRSISGRDEKELLLAVADVLNKNGALCAHYGKGFDYPVLSRKFVMHGIPLPGCLDNAGKKPWEINLIDTSDLWKFGDLKHTASLDLIAHCLGLPSPKTDMQGSDVSGVYWNAEDGLTKITEYCERDVTTLINVHRRITGLPAIV